MFAPSIKFTNILIENGGKPLVVSNPHIDSDAETTTNTGSQNLYKLTIKFSVLDQYNDSGVASWIEDEDVRKYIKYSISYYKSNGRITTKVNSIFENTNFDLISYLKYDSNGNRYYEYPITYKIDDFVKNIQTQTITIIPYFDLKNYVLDKGLPNNNITNEFGRSLIVEVIRNFNIVNSQNIINNSILEDIVKVPINTYFVNSLENQLISIIESNKTNKDISPYFTNLFISKDESNKNHILFGIDKKRIIRTKSQIGNYVDSIVNSTALREAIVNNIFIKDIKIFKNQVKKINSINKLEEVTDDYVVVENSQQKIIELNDSNQVNLFIDSDLTYYNFIDEDESNAENSSFQYSIHITIQDSFNEVLYQLYNNLLNDIKVLENYYNLISIPYASSDSLTVINPHIDSSSETFIRTRSVGYYDLKTNTFKNVTSDLIPNLEQISLNFSSLYFMVFSLNKSIILDVLNYSLALKEELVKSLFVSSTDEPSSTLYVVSKTIELIKSFSSIVERTFKFKSVDIDSETSSFSTIKIGSSTNNIIELNYVFQDIITNNYFNNFKRNKFLLIEPSYVDNYPSINSSKLSNYLSTTAGNLQPILNSNLNIIYDNFINLSNSTNIDSKEFRLLVSFFNNYLIYLNKNLTNIDFDLSEEYNLTSTRGEFLKPYKSLVLDVLQKNSLNVESFKINKILEVTRNPVPEPSFTQTDPLNYSIPTPRETFVNSSPVFDIELDNKKRESIEKLLNYVLSSYNDNQVLTIDYKQYAKKDTDLSNFYNFYIPKYQITYLENFGNSIKDNNWTSLNQTTFANIPLRSRILCRFEPILNQLSYEVKNVINNLQIPYMYFILFKDNTQFGSTTSSLLNERLGNFITPQQRNGPEINMNNEFIQDRNNQTYTERESQFPNPSNNAPFVEVEITAEREPRYSLATTRPRITRR